jgi:hypothetical protein
MIATLIATFWTCTAISPLGKIYEASMPTLDQARTAVITDCKKTEKACILTKCELTGGDGE